ncbi:Uncharacterized protein YrrD, contains PRC-barrel domain [Evansella caseinilytica]|uniref:Uncharacterized protein YrrD, contains PRC-barrel domain n=1 Tax=Evansella caseinilytica TaxID=1503961 RepID=A0A1H3K900_9BACI|nr:PRC-barrel domain-containing protein [Evansella caseinilytica]SDY48652.1 Uncharacterized protein YrrD, contains PRC-barrel domain [Evansella caseinilytica]
MRTFKKVKGAPVFFVDSRLHVGKITDIILSENSVKGFWIQTSRWWSKKRFLPLERLADEDGEGLYVKPGTALIPIPHKAQRFSNGNQPLLGKAMVDKEGTTLGIVEDVYFLPDTGKIVGYELTEGLFSDLTQGIKVVKPKSPNIKWENSFIVLTES